MKTTTQIQLSSGFIVRGLRARTTPADEPALHVMADDPLYVLESERSGVVRADLLCGLVHAAVQAALAEACPPGANWKIVGLRIDFNGPALYEAVASADVAAVEWGATHVQTVSVTVRDGRQAADATATPSITGGVSVQLGTA